MDNFLDALIDVGLRTTIIYLLMIAGIIILGKRELSQLSIIDLVFILLISNSVQNAMVGENTSLTGGIISGGVLFLWNYTLKILKFRFPFLNRVIQGNAIMLIYEGKIQYQNLHKIKFTEDELMAAVREHGVKNLNDVEMAVLETDGNISVIAITEPDGIHKKLTKKKVPMRVKKN